MSLKKFLRSRERFIHVSVQLSSHEVKDEAGVVHVIHLPTLAKGITRFTRVGAYARSAVRQRVLMRPSTNVVHHSTGL